MSKRTTERLSAAQLDMQHQIEQAVRPVARQLDIAPHDAAAIITNQPPVFNISKTDLTRFRNLVEQKFGSVANLFASIRSKVEAPDASAEIA